MKRFNLFLISVITIILSFVFYTATLFYAVVSVNGFTLEKAGFLGSSFGCLNSLFTGLSFIGVIWAIIKQQEELVFIRKNQALDTLFDKNLAKIEQNRSSINFLDMKDKYFLFKNQKLCIENFYTKNNLINHFKLYGRIVWILEKYSQISKDEKKYNLELLLSTMTVDEHFLLNQYFKDVSPPQLPVAIKNTLCKK